jgi:RNA 2',3'-cyclic 3'-phosphodiesterase
VRLFAAVVPPAEVIDHLDRAAAPVRAAGAELRWIPTARWHLTLAFYGEVADRDVARVERRGLRATQDGVALDLRFAGGGQFGSRVLWAGVQGDRAALLVLAGRLATDGRPYRPHLTLARARPDGHRRPAVDGDQQPAVDGDQQPATLQRGDDLRAAVAMLAPYEGPVWRASEVVLFRSHLGPKPTHEPIARWPLAAAN